MLILGIEHLRSLIEGRTHSAKMVFNGNGAIVFPTAKQHRDMKAESISYEDNYKGNALAAMLQNGKVEIRFHQRFSDAEVAGIMRELVRQTGLDTLADWGVTYQGRVISPEPSQPPSSDPQTP